MTHEPIPAPSPDATPARATSPGTVSPPGPALSELDEPRPAAAGEDAAPQPPQTPDTFSEDAAAKLGFTPRAHTPVWRSLNRDHLHWVATAASVLLAALIRLIDLGGVTRIAFDETYYVKDAYSLWHLGYEGRWGDKVDEAFAAGDFSSLTTNPSFVVHPQLGKWLLGLGPQIFGWEHPWAWRLTPAIAGILMVLILCRIVRRLFDAPALTLVAGLFLAVDGVAVSVSRIGLLDVFSGVFLLAGFATLLRDQYAHHRVLVADLRAMRGTPGGRESTGLWRPWLLTTAVLWGCACGVKWTALYVVAAGGLFVFIREVTVRWSAGVRGLGLVRRSVLRGGVPAFIQLVPLFFVTYLVTWTSWFLHPGAYGHGATGKSGLAGAVADFVKYQRDTLNFHTHVTSEHTYQANAAQWILDLRPTSMMWETRQTEGGELVRASTTIGNPLMWWFGLAALFFVLVVMVWIRDWRAGFIVTGYAGMWAPWFLYWDRTIFMFYTVILVPFVVLAVLYLIGTFTGSISPVAYPLAAWEHDYTPPRLTVGKTSRIIGYVLVFAIFAIGLFFVPVTAAWEIPKDHWSWRMWLPTWI